MKLLAVGLALLALGKYSNRANTRADLHEFSAIIVVCLKKDNLCVCMYDLYACVDSCMEVCSL